MEFNGTNIYKLARKMACLTQDEALDKINLRKKLSLRSLARYESGELIPTSLTVKEMVRTYNAPWLGYLHLHLYDDLGKSILPQIDINRFSTSVLRFQKEHRDIMKVENSMLEIAYDDILDETEEEWINVEKKIGGIVSTGLALLFTKAFFKGGGKDDYISLQM